MPKITVYIKAYNVEKYIDQCIKSVLNQTFTDFECILVDNGSTDETKKYIQEISNNDSRFKTFRFEQNSILPFTEIVKENARGEYFTLLDSDDYLDNDYLEKLYSFTIENSLDIAITGTKFYNTDINLNGILRKVKQKTVIPKNSFGDVFPYIHQHLRTMWGKLIKMDVIKNTDTTTYKDIIDHGGYGGDTAFIIDSLQNCERIGITDECLYTYRIHKKSMSHKFDLQRNIANQILYRQSEAFLNKYKNLSNQNLAFINKVYLNSVIDELNILINSTNNLVEKYNLIEQIFKEKLTKQAYDFVEKDIDDFILSYNVTIIKYLIKSSKSLRSNQSILATIYECIITINKELYFWIQNDEIISYLKNEKFLIESINADSEQLIINVIKTMKDKKLGLLLWKPLKRKFIDNLILNSIDNYNVVSYCPEIIIKIYYNEFADALKYLFLYIEQNSKTKIIEDLLKLAINLASYLNNAEDFIYSKKLLTEFYIENNYSEQANKELNELIEICTLEDEDIKYLQSYFEQKYC